MKNYLGATRLTGLFPLAGLDANYRVAPGMPAPAETYFLVRCGLRATLRLNCVLVV